jgi:hypothetical protein
MGIALALVGVCLLLYPLYFGWIVQFNVITAIVSHVGYIVLLVGVLGTGTDVKRRQS